MSLSLNDPAKNEERVKVLSTFRLLSREDLQPRYAKLIEELTPAPLPQDSQSNRPTTDAQNAALKGPVKQIVTEREYLLSETFFSDREIMSREL